MIFSRTFTALWNYEENETISDILYSIIKKEIPIHTCILNMTLFLNGGHETINKKL